MKILAFSDLHRNLEVATAIVEASRDADVVVGAGDFATRGEGLAATFDILRAVAVPFILVAGNHDDPDEMRHALSGWPHPHLLQGHGVGIGSFHFFGLGLGIPRSGEEAWNRQLSEDEAATLLEACPEACVLVTHAPPFGVADLQHNGQHEGSQAIRAAIEARQPRLALCGHIHHAWGMTGMIGSTPVHNLGPRLHWFEL